LINNIFKYGEDQMTPGIAIGMAKGEVVSILSKNTQRKIRRGFKALGGIVKMDVYQVCMDQKLASRPLLRVKGGDTKR